MRWLFRLVGRDRLEKQLDAELRFHVEEETRRLVSEGVPAAEAKRRALAAFGGLEPMKEYARDARGTRWLEDLWRDVRYGARMFRRSPGFTLAAVASLAVAIGANGAIFSVIDALLLRSLPVERPEELVFLNRTGRGEPILRFSHPALLRYQQAFPDVNFIARSAPTSMQMIADGPAELVSAELVTGDWFSVLGVEPVAGRLLTPHDARVIDREPVAVLSYEFWMRRFGGSQSILGSTVQLNKLPVTIVGIAPRGFAGISVGTRVSFWLPLTLQHAVRFAGNNSTDNADRRKPWIPQNGIEWITIVGRVPPTIDRNGLSVRMAAMHRQLIEEQIKDIQDPERRAINLRESLELMPAWRGLSSLRDNFAEPLRVLMATTAVVLLIGCANLASLLLARGTARRRELALRLSLGAARGRIVRQLLTESVLLAAVGGFAALLLARWGARTLLMLASTSSTPIPLNLSFDWKFVAFTAALSVLTGIAFGLAPALRVSRADLSDAMRSSSRSSGSSDRQGRIPFGRMLIVTQVTLALTLLVGAVAFVRTFRNLVTFETGYNREYVITARFDPRLAGFTDDQMPALSERLLEQARRVPGARSVSLAMSGAATGSWRMSGGINIEGQAPRHGPDGVIREDYVGQDYFETIGMSIVRGRNFRPDDAPKGPRVAVVNETLARRFFGDTNPIGRHFGYEIPPEFEIVGVVRDAQIDGPRGGIPAFAYYPLSQHPDEYVGNLYVRVTSAPDVAKGALMRAVANAVPSLAVREVVTLGELTERTVARERLVSQITAAFGLLAVGVACLGLYATVSYSVTRRTTELGLRLALGATPGAVRWLVLRETLLVVGVGTVAGIVLAIAALQYVSTLLFGLSPSDPALVGTAAAGLLAVGALAALIPAVRAARTDPARALRAE